MLIGRHDVWLCRHLAQFKYEFRPENGFFSLQNEMRVWLHLVSSIEVGASPSCAVSPAPHACVSLCALQELLKQYPTSVLVDDLVIEVSHCLIQPFSDSCSCYDRRI